MIDPKAFYEALIEYDAGVIAGVPDSLLADFCAYVEDYADKEQHIIAANEGNAVAIAVGHYMATEKTPIVYMQNSGLGNTVNPLTSLADAEVYQIPMVLVVGWRGEPGVKDEPQHVKQGRISSEMLELLGIEHWVLDPDSDVVDSLGKAFQEAKRKCAPVALLVRKNTFSQYKSKRASRHDYPMSRETAIGKILQLADPNDVVVSTTGKASREVFSLRVERGENQRDFLTVGGMGHTSSIALGVALGKPEKRVLCIDGDGSVLMHMGALAIIGDLAPRNFIHILLNNAAHESVGGQPTVGDSTNFKSIVLGAGYSAYYCAEDERQLVDCWSNCIDHSGPVLLEVKIKLGSRTDLGRPDGTPADNKRAFMRHVSQT